jgi:hypothetical protein
MKRIWLLVGLATLSACSDAPTLPPIGDPDLSVRAGSAAPSPLVDVTAGGSTQRLWPFTGTDFSSTPQDPINLVFVGAADARNVRNALLSLGGDRGGSPFAGFDCTWTDAIGGQQTAHAEQVGWSGSVIQLECGDYDPFRFHVRLFPAGGWTIANAHVDLLIPGTTDHQVLSWELGEQFVTYDLARSGFLGGVPGRTGVINPAPTFRSIPPVIYNLLPPTLRGLTGGPLTGTVTEPVGIPTDGQATIVPLRAAPAAPGTSQSLELQFGQTIPKPFCAAGDFVRVDGPIHLHHRVEVSASGVLTSETSIEGELMVRALGATGLGEPNRARVHDHYQTHINGKHFGVFSMRKQQLSLPARPPQQLHRQLQVGSNGPARFREDEKCR